MNVSSTQGTLPIEQLNDSIQVKPLALSTPELRHMYQQLKEKQTPQLLEEFQTLYYQTYGIEL